MPAVPGLGSGAPVNPSVDSTTSPSTVIPIVTHPGNSASLTEKEKDYSREIANIAKMCTEEDKYSGTEENDNLDHKLAIFQDFCRRVKLPPQEYITAFPAMLKGAA